ncbi:MAG: hypothetical protein AABZ60_04385, partial [Planctomycetota bacterium]
SLINMVLNGKTSASSESSQFWNFSIPQIKDLIAQKQILLTHLLQFQKKLQESTILFVPSSYSYEEILEEIRNRPIDPLSTALTEEEQLIEFARKILQTCIPSKEKGY